jgi:serine/threonine protein kinase
MEFVSLGSLASVLRKKEVELSWQQRVKFALDGARGMWFLHDTLNILHRDLKSDNLLVETLNPDADGTVKVTDFSISREAPRELVKMTLNTGTAQWRAPEVCKGQAPTRASDVYSYGVIMWEILTREIPFSEIKWQYEVEKEVVSGTRPKIPQQIWIPPDYRTLMEKMWVGDPAKRPSFKDAIEALRICQMSERFSQFTFEGVYLKEELPDDDDGGD